MGISLRIVIALLITLATVISTLVAFIPTYISGVTAVRSSLSDLRNSYVARTEESIDAFFDLPIATLTDLQTAVTHDLFNLTDLDNWTRWLSNYTLHYSASIKVATYRLWGDTGTNYTLWRSMDIRGTRVTGALLYEANATVVTISPYDTATYTVSDSPIYQGERDTTTQTDQEVFARANPTANVKWTPIYSGATTPEISAVMIIPDKTASVPTARGYITTDMTAISLAAFFVSLELRSGARAILVEGDSGIMLGNSWGEETAIDLDGGRLDPAWLKLALKTLTNHSDSTVLDVVSHIGVDSILNGGVPLVTELYSGRRLTYVNVIEVTGPGLRLRLLLVMPEIDFMEDVYESQTSTIILVVVLALAVICLGIALAHRLVTPLVDLQERMELTARLKDTDDEDAEISVFSEVGDMQQAYRRMKAELNRMKSYLPQSVLFPNDSTDEDGCEADEEAEGTLEVVSETALSNSAARSSSVAAARFAQSSQSQNASSDSRSVLSASGVKGGGLNTRGEIFEKRVTVAVFNLKNFHHVRSGGGVGVRAGNSAAMARMQKEYLQIIQRVTRENKGVVDVFQGDHVTCSFNAVGNCVASNRKAVHIATHVTETFQECPVTVGIACGIASVGNMGTDEMRRFCIVGPVVPQAMALERLTKTYSSAVRILISHSMFEDVQHECRLAVVDRLRLPGSHKPQLVAAVLGIQLKSENDEWMYNLAVDAKSNPFQLLNQAWVYVAVGRSEVAVKLTEVDKELEAIETTNAVGTEGVLKGEGEADTKVKAISPALREVIDCSVKTLSQLLMESKDEGGWNADKVYTELGRFFTDCVL